MSYDKNELKASLKLALEDMDLGTYRVKEAVYHLTDWLADLDQWQSYCSDPSKLDIAEIQSLLMKFLTHVPPHIVTASKLVTGLPVADIFEEGATSEKTK